MQPSKNITWDAKTRTLRSAPSQYQIQRNPLVRKPSWRKNSDGIFLGVLFPLLGILCGLLPALIAGVIVDSIFGYSGTEGWSTPGSYVFFAGLIIAFAIGVYHSSLKTWLEAVSQWKETHADFFNLFKNRPHAVEAEPEYLAYMLVADEKAYRIVQVGTEWERTLCGTTTTNKFLGYSTVCTVPAPDDLHEAIALGVELAEEVSKLEASSKLEYTTMLRQQETDTLLAKEEAKSAALEGELRKQAMRSASGYSK